MLITDSRSTCIMMLSCIGAGPKYFLPLSNDFDHKYRLLPYVYLSMDQTIEIKSLIEQQIDNCDVFIYHNPDWTPFGKFRDAYEELIAQVPDHALKIEFPMPSFHAFWPFHVPDPRNDPNGPLNRHGELPWFHYGDSYILQLLKQRMSCDEVITHYLNQIGR